MKNYKVGDTIYIKDTVNNIDEHDPIGTYRGKYTGWFANRTIIDELPVAEPVKPVLPKEVADELEDAKKSAYNFFGFLREYNNKTYPETCYFMFYDTVSSDTQIKILSDAWYNGYTVEKPKLYNLILGKDGLDYTIAVVKTLQDKSKTLISADVKRCDLTRDRWQFTQTEIDELNNDFYIKNIDLNDYKELVTDD